MHMTTAAEAVKLIRSHDSVYIQGSTSIPEVLVRAMADRGEELRGVKVYSGFAVGRADAPYCRAEYRDSFLVNSLFVANNIRRWLAEGYGQSIPAFLGEIPGFFRDGTLPVDVALLNLSRPNAEGYCSYGVSADLAVSAVECAKTVIAQINDAMPFSYGDALIHTSRIAAAVEVNDPLVEVPSATPNEVESRIGGYIAEMIPDGATLQIGVGGIPNAVLTALHDHKQAPRPPHRGDDRRRAAAARKGHHRQLAQEGAAGHHRGVAGPRLAPAVRLHGLPQGPRDEGRGVDERSVPHPREPPRDGHQLGRGDRSHGAGVRRLGGQHDFMYGGALSEGGKTFIAMPSMTPKGESKIKAHLTPGAGVVTTRHMIQHVVTEYGVAHLRGRNLAQRARALIDIAHPSVREELEQAACRRFGYSFIHLKR